MDKSLGQAWPDYFFKKILEEEGPLLQLDFETPEDLAPGWVIEWIYKPIGGGKGKIKIYVKDSGEEAVCHEITNGYPCNVLDFMALAQNMANVRGLDIDSNNLIKDIILEPNTSIRCLVTSGC